VVDVTAFDAFPLRRRFLDPATGELASHFAGRVTPITAQEAAALAEQGAAQCADSGAFTSTFRTDDSPGVVTGRLRTLPIADDATVIVSWDRSTALMTEWGVFVGHWDDFCYPASDDISIRPTAGEWTLCYRRYEVIQFRSHSQPG
jgi:hypothetical protein